MNRALCLAPLLALACGTNLPASPLGEFTAPTGLAATGAGDRDVVFVANSGRDGLRALQLCNHALLPDGGVDPQDTCPSNVNGQFVPAPIRVFPATIETGDRPLRVAGVRLSRADGSAAGVGLAVGADSSVAVVDARSLVEAQRDPAAIPKPIQHLDVGARTVDVVAANPMHPDLDVEIAAAPGLTVPAFVATETELLVLDVGLDSSGSAQLPAIRSRCALAPVVPTKIAVVPGSPDQVYVADGAGDGVVAVATSSIAGGACAMDRIGAGGRSVRSLSLSPKWYQAVPGPPGGPPEIQVEHPAGELLIMVANPLDVVEPGTELDPGGVLLARTGLGGGPKGLLPIPPFDFTDATQERMQPLSLPFLGLTREATFMRSVKPRPFPAAPDLSTCTGAPCTPLYVGVPANAPVHLFNLLAAVSATDGATYFIDVSNRRFVNTSLYALENDAGLVPILDPTTVDGTTHQPILSPASANPAVLTVDTNSVEPGVTRQVPWRVLWHSPIPGLDRRGGTLTPTGTGTLRFTSAPANFAVWQNDPAIKLAPGDVVSFGAFFLAGDNSAACQAVASVETAYRFELPILAITADSLELGELPDTPGQVGFHPDACSALGAVAEVRTGGAQPWLVLEGATAQGRVEPDGTFVVRQRRFDYPRTSYSPGDASTAPQASAAHDVAFTFTITGPQPTIKSGFNFGMLSGQAFVHSSDGIALAGFATAVYAYSSPRAQSLVFTSITGSNEVLQADPSLLASNLVTGIVAYR